MRILDNVVSHTEEMACQRAEEIANPRAARADNPRAKEEASPRTARAGSHRAGCVVNSVAIQVQQNHKAAPGTGDDQLDEIARYQKYKSLQLDILCNHI